LFNLENIFLFSFRLVFKGGVFRANLAISKINAETLELAINMEWYQASFHFALHYSSEAIIFLRLRHQNRLRLPVPVPELALASGF
jgi:hypothetical protein